VLFSDTPFIGSPHGEVISSSLLDGLGNATLVVSVVLDSVVVILTTVFRSGYSEFVVRSTSWANGSGVRPDVVLSFVDGSTVHELLLDVPEVKSVCPDGLENNGEEAEEHLHDRDVHASVIVGVRHDSATHRVSLADSNEPENLEYPVKSNVVPRVNVTPNVESIEDSKVSRVREEPHEEERQGENDSKDHVEKPASGLPSRSLQCVSPSPCVNADNVGTAHGEH
jgi:hypothetical protein